MKMTLHKLGNFKSPVILWRISRENKTRSEAAKSV